jgi:hypothetical protein
MPGSHGAATTCALPLTLALALLAASACDTGRPPQASDQETHRELDQETHDRVVALGGSAATTFAQTLAAGLFAEIEEGGTAHAIDFCSREAEALADSVRRDLGPGWEVKRTTRRTRNPDNEPDDLERQALDRFHAAWDADEPLEHHVQRTPSGNYRFYRPLMIAPLCVQCHGPRDDLDPTVRGILEERYPHDTAVGYTVGDFRGLVRVTVPADAVGR